jgi:hypothetical protein
VAVAIRRSRGVIGAADALVLDKVPLDAAIIGPASATTATIAAARAGARRTLFLDVTN